MRDRFFATYSGDFTIQFTAYLISPFRSIDLGSAGSIVFLGASSLSPSSLADLFIHGGGGRLGSASLGPLLISRNLSSLNYLRYLILMSFWNRERHFETFARFLRDNFTTREKSMPSTSARFYERFPRREAASRKLTPNPLIVPVAQKNN